MKLTHLSQSAAFITIKFYGLTRDERYRALFEKETIRYYEKMVSFLPAPLSYYHYWLQFKWARLLYIAAEEMLLPGDLLHILARKQFVEHMADDLLEEGYDQVLILGSGLDHLGLRYARSNKPTIEIDTLRMSQYKQAFLDQHYPHSEHPHLLGCNLSEQPLSKILECQEILTPKKKTIVIAEGFFDYLAPPTVHNTLSNLRDYFSSPAVISTHFALDELSPFHRWIFQTSLRFAGEPLQFHTSMDEFEQILDEYHLWLSSCYGTDDLATRLNTQVEINLPLLKGFYLFTAK
ncbi:class I SAM-dependent methyltransferase [Aliifodinibius salicampi]|uniref:Class I SAM-dependent methyltransferase n=1 Tax=Fodinibius salicampi TaxID=1920655 RepID=A0ABT3PWC7_9BACT|nr:class I SAM-dependent methyltransferase [Fodinibius salicampi]MCW9712150.1 class I SAM-dependent methyltransferase [Fodinibius salicampi]